MIFGWSSVRIAWRWVETRGWIVVLLQEILVGLESSIDAGLLAACSCGALDLAWHCPIAWGKAPRRMCARCSQYRGEVVVVEGGNEVGGEEEVKMGRGGYLNSVTLPTMSLLLFIQTKGCGDAGRPRSLKDLLIRHYRKMLMACQCKSVIICLQVNLKI
jgi:hypothetical protein